MKAVAFVLIIFFASLSHAHIDSPGSGDDRPSTQSDELATIQRYRDFSGSWPRMIPRSSECEKILVQASGRVGRALTDQEIAELLPLIFQETGEELVEIDTTPLDAGHSCFTGEMNVTTPSGPRRIAELQPGDEVISIDLIHQRPVVNVIDKVSVANDRPFGRLVSLSRPINVTRRHPFSVSNPSAKFEFRAIEDVTASDHLTGVNLSKPQGGILRSVLRGCYVPQGSATVHNLELIGEPRNFIVEGVLVHNGLKVLF